MVPFFRTNDFGVAKLVGMHKSINYLEIKFNFDYEICGLCMQLIKQEAKMYQLFKKQ